MRIFFKKQKNGFTLVELMIIIALIGLLSSIVLVSVKDARKNARITNLYEAQSTIHHALGAYLLAEWRFNEGSGATVKDSSGYNNNGSFYGIVEWTTDTPLHRGYGLLFGNHDGCVEIDLLNGSLGKHTYNDFTITAWYKSTYDDIINDEYIYHHYSSYMGGPDTIIFGVTDDEGYSQKLRFHYKVTAGTQLTYGTSDVVDKQWHFVAASRGAGRVKIYVDGNLEINEATTLTQGLTPGTSVLSIGCEPDDPGDPDQLYGVLDEILVYDEDLSLTQIQNLYAEGLPKRLFADKIDKTNN